MATVRIHGILMSNYVQSVMMVAREKGVEVELVKPEKALGDATFPALHPWGKVPVLTVGSFTLFETSAILRWLDARRAEPMLVPLGADQAASMEQWISAGNSYLDRHMMREIAVPTLKARRNSEPHVVSEAALAALAHDLDVFEGALVNGTHLCGASPTLADFLVAPIVNYVALMVETRSLLDKRTGLRRFLEAIHARPSSEGILRRPW